MGLKFLEKATLRTFVGNVSCPGTAGKITYKDLTGIESFRDTSAAAPSNVMFSF